MTCHVTTLILMLKQHLQREIKAYLVVTFCFSEGEGGSNSDKEEMPHPLLPKPESPVMKSVEELNVLSEDDESGCWLQCFNVPLRHGVNEYNLTAQVRLSLDYEQSLLPFLDARARITRERARKSSVSWKRVALVGRGCERPTQASRGQSSIFYV